MNSPGRKAAGTTPSASTDSHDEDKPVEGRAGAGAGASEEAEAVYTPFVPTQEWVDEVRAELPLATTLRLLKHLTPQIEDLGATGAAHGLTGVLTSGGLEERQVLDFIRETTMVGLLPVPHPIVIRKYVPSSIITPFRG